jgi:hypothetical protein
MTTIAITIVEMVKRQNVFFPEDGGRVYFRFICLVCAIRTDNSFDKLYFLYLKRGKTFTWHILVAIVRGTGV